jgi:DNA-binding transcriptional MerR regulator
LRIAELSRASGVSIDTIKYYLREGLLTPGIATAQNQATYSEGHVRRLRLIRALTEIGRLSLKTVRDVLNALDDERLPVHRLLGMALYASEGEVPDDDASDEMLSAQAEVDRFLVGMGWQVSAKAPSRRRLAQTLVTLRRLGRPADAQIFRRYARLADRLAAWEVGEISGATSRAEVLEDAVVGSLVFGEALMALRRLAQEHHSTIRRPRGPSAPARSDDPAIRRQGK